MSEERSDELKVISYVGRRYNSFAVASLQPSFAPRSASPVATVSVPSLVHAY